MVFPYLIGEELLSGKPPAPQRYIIDFHPRDVFHAGQYDEPLKQVEKLVLPAREDAATREERRNQEALKDNPKARVNRHHRNFLKKWWLLSYARAELIEKISGISRYIVCARLTKRPVFEFVDCSIRPNDMLQVFPLADDYSFGILQSRVHWEWFNEQCSTLKRDFRYTSNTVFDSFPFPQSPTLAQAKKVAEKAVELRKLRCKVISENQWSLRELYRTLDLPGENPLRKAHIELDIAVRKAYGMTIKEDSLHFLLGLNSEVANREAKSLPVVAPGLPSVVTNPNEFITDDCVSVAEV